MQNDVGLATEMALLRASVRAYFDGYKDFSDLNDVLPRVDWTRAFWLGRLHGSLLFVREALNRAGARVPDEVAAQLNAINEASIRRRLARGAELCRVHDTFERAGIEALALSGWLFTERFYEVPRLLDVGTVTPYAVRAEDRARAAQALKPMGYLVDDPLEDVTTNRSRVKLRVDLDEQLGPDLWSRTPTFEIAGRAVRVLAPEDWLTILTSRIDGSGWTPLYLAANVISLQRYLGVASSDYLLDEIVRNPLPRRALQANDAIDIGDDRSAGNFIATPVTFVERMLQLAETGENDVVYDLGCGNGNAVITAASAFGARGVGIDNDPALIAEANAAAGTVADRVQFKLGNLFTADLSEATVLFLYLHQSAYGDIHRTIIPKLRPGTRVVSRDSTFRGWIPDKSEVISISPQCTSMIYKWTVR